VAKQKWISTFFLCNLAPKGQEVLYEAALSLAQEERKAVLICC